LFFAAAEVPGSDGDHNKPTSSKFNRLKGVKTTISRKKGINTCAG
jgi:hypothetical protein